MKNKKESKKIIILPIKYKGISLLFQTRYLKKVDEVIIIVDMVNGFVKEGNMATPNMERLIPELTRLLEIFRRKENGLIIFVKEAHDKLCSEFEKFPEHCIKGTWEAEIIDEFKKYLKDAIVIEKNSTSAIFAPGFMEIIKRMKNLKRVVVGGGCSDICSMDVALPLSNFFDQENRRTKVIFPKNANDTYDAPNHNRDEYNEMAYKFMSQAGIEVVDRYVDQEELEKSKGRVKKF